MDHWLASVESREGWKRDCLAAAEDPGVFAIFRQLPWVRWVVENRGQEVAEEYLLIVETLWPELLERLESLSENDAIGTPITFGLRGGRYRMSGTLACYMKATAMMRSVFGSMAGFHVAEIGGGYGGLCACLQVAFPLANYTIFDLREALSLQEKFLEKANRGPVTLIGSGIKPHRAFDLVISDCALAELDQTARDWYGEQVLLPATRGFIGWSYFDPYTETDRTAGWEWLCALLSPTVPTRIDLHNWWWERK